MDTTQLLLATGAIGFGLYLLVIGGNWTIDSAVYIAEKLQVSKLFIGFTILAFGTSLPELFVSVNANLSGYPAIALGNVVGSNIANILLVLGLTAIIYPVAIAKQHIKLDLAIMLIATISLQFLCLQKVIPNWQGLILFTALVIKVVFKYFSAKNHKDETPDVPHPHIKNTYIASLLLIFGLVLIGLGAEFLITGASTGAALLGISEGVISLTVVAFGTSVPELATCIIAARKQHTEMIFGNVIGSNIFNILSIIGITTIIKPLTIMPEVAGNNLLFLSLISFAVAIWIVLIGKINRITGTALSLIYFAFVIVQYLKL